MHLVLSGDETKNHAPYEMTLPESTAKLLCLYLNKYKPLLSKTPSPFLFPNPDGNCRSTGGFAVQIGAWIFKKTGLRMNAHLFRHLAAKIHLDRHPDDLETARRILGHKSIQTTLRFYADIKAATSIRRYDDVVAALRMRYDSPLSVQMQ